MTHRLQKQKAINAFGNPHTQADALRRFREDPQSLVSKPKPLVPPITESTRPHSKTTQDLLSSLKSPRTISEALAAIDAGADVNARDSDGLTPLMLAAKLYHDVSEKIDAARLGFDLEVETNTSAFDDARATAEHTLILVDSVIKSLLAQGADANAKDNIGQDVFDQRRSANWPPALHKLRPDIKP